LVEIEVVQRVIVVVDQDVGGGQLYLPQSLALGEQSAGVQVDHRDGPAVVNGDGGEELVDGSHFVSFAAAMTASRLAMHLGRFHFSWK